MKNYYVAYETQRAIYIATRKPKVGISYVKFTTMQAARLFRNKVTNKGS